MIRTVLATFRRLVSAMNPKTVGGGLVFSLLSTAVVVAAVISDGTSATNVQLNDGSVWVVDHGRQRVGRLNIRIRELDFSIGTSPQGEVLQEGRSVVLSGGNGGVNVLDVLSGGFRNTTNEINIDDYHLGAGVAALLNAETGDLWVGPPETVVAPDFPEGADLRLPEGSKVVVSDVVEGRFDRFGRATGTVLVVSEAGWFELPLDGATKPDRSLMAPEALSDPDASSDVPPPFDFPEASPFPIASTEIVQLSSVGAVPVALTEAGSVVTPSATSVPIPGDQWVLQQSGRASERALVASNTGLFTVSLETGAVERLSAQTGQPAAPVRVGPCEFGAWASASSTAFKRCNGDVRYDGREPPGVVPNEPLVWRVNRGNVALNSPGNGGLWADHEGELAFVGNWDDVEPLSDDASEREESVAESLEFVERLCLDGGSDAPVAGDDQLGARPRQTVLNVLTNDDDVNCEPIAVSSVSPSAGEWGQLTIIDDGQHLLYSPSNEMVDAGSEAPQTFTFEYTVADSSGNSSTPAAVTVTVKPIRINAAPELLPKNDGRTREMRTVVEEGRSVSYDVLGDWWDPDGDELRLVDAVSEGGGEVASTPEGLVRFAANGVNPGVVKVRVSMSDGLLTSTEVLEVTVQPTGSELPPVVSSDFATVVQGSTVSVSPLENDSDPNEDRLDLRPLWLSEESTGYRSSIESDGSVSITGLEPGVYALPYEAYDGVEATGGTIRVAVLLAPEINTAPVAVPDLVKIRANRVINVDVLSNDIDLDGDILSVSEVTVGTTDESFGTLGATIVDRELVQLEVRPGPNGEVPTGPFTLTYKVDDGQQAERSALQNAEQNTADAIRSLGSVTVLVQAAEQDQPPILMADRAVVRSGDVVAVPVLRNDIDPDGDQITLVSVDPERAATLEASGEGTAWVDGRDVFFQGAAPGRYSILYNVRAGDRQASSELTVEVRPLPTDDNQAPAPKDLVLRAVRNGEVRLAVPLFGVDPDGDSVEVLNEFSEPEGSAAGNRVTLDPEDPNVIIFSAAGTAPPNDSFTYTVRDRFGLRGTATVEVVLLDIDGPPQAFDDVFVGRPGRTISIPVLANDTSPLDRRLEMAEMPFFDAEGQPSATAINASVTLLDQTDETDRGRIDVVVPSEGAPTLVEHYRISDGRSGSSAFIRVSSDPDAPNLPPVANTDQILLSELIDDQVHTLDVLDNDYDPDDVDGQLILEMPEGQNGSVTQDNRIQVNLSQLDQTVLYRITDADGATTIGQIKVPGKQNAPPQLSAAGQDASLRIVEAASAAPLRVALTDIVEDPDGDDFELTTTEVRVFGGLGSVIRDDNGLGFTYTPPPELQTSQTITIGFEVTDRPNQTADQRQLPNCNCIAPLLVDLTIAASSPPRVLSIGAVEVPQFKEPVTYDLEPLTIDDQGDVLNYVVDESELGGLRLVSQSGSTITLVSELGGDDTLAVGTTLTVPYTVDDGTFDPVNNSFVVTVVQTNALPPSTTPISGIEATRDERFEDIPNLVDLAFNPFAGTGDVLTLDVDSITVEPGPATFTCTASGDCSFLTDTVGTYTATYTLRDVIGRTTTSTVEFNVKGLPRAPGIPSIESVGDKLVNLTWSAADMQGGELVHYVVTVVETGVSKEFTSTGGVFDGLVNGETYRFTVVAVNEVGPGDSSEQSSPATPDRVPSAPTLLGVTDYQDQTLSLQWAPPPDAADYTAILRYEVSIGGYTVFVDGGTTSVVVGPTPNAGGPLVNGLDQSFTVRAQNSAITDNGWGAWSGDSPSERPSRYPDSPTNVVAVNSGDGGQPRLTVTWDAPAFDGGRPITSYEVCRVQAPQDCVVRTDLTATFDAGRNESNSFVVRAVNSDKNRSVSDDSDVSALVTSVGVPDAPVISAVASGDGQLTATASSANNSGCGAFFIEYSINGGGTWQTSPVFNGLSNGTAYDVIARTTLSAGCYAEFSSPASNAVTQTPYGPLVAPAISVQVNDDQARWSWDTNRADDGRPGWSAQLSGDCTTASLPTAPNQTGTTAYRTYGHSTSVSCAITVSAPGEPSLSVVATATTDPPPVGSVTIGLGSSSPGGACWNAANISEAGGDPTMGCYNIRVTLSGWDGSQTVRCFSSTNAEEWVEFASFTASNGTYNRCSYSQAGRWVIVVVGGGTIQGQTSPLNPTSVPSGSVASAIYGQWPTF